MRREDFGVSFTSIANRGLLKSRSALADTTCEHEKYLATRTKSKMMTRKDDESFVVGEMICPPITNEQI